MALSKLSTYCRAGRSSSGRLNVVLPFEALVFRVRAAWRISPVLTPMEHGADRLSPLTVPRGGKAETRSQSIPPALRESLTWAADTGSKRCPVSALVACARVTDCDLGRSLLWRRETPSMHRTLSRMPALRQPTAAARVLEHFDNRMGRRRCGVWPLRAHRL